MSEPIASLHRSAWTFPSHVQVLLEKAQAGQSLDAITQAWTLPLTPTTVEPVRLLAEHQMDMAPRAARLLATVAYTFACRAHDTSKQGHRIRSLRGRCATTLATAERCFANYVAAEQLLEEAFGLLKGYRNTTGRLRAEVAMAWLLRDRDRYDEAERAFRAAIAELERWPDGAYELANAYRGLGQTLRARNRYTEAVEQARMAFDLYSRLGDTLAAARCQLDTAFALLLQDKDKALEEVEAARATFNQANARLDLAETDRYTGLIYSEQTHYAKALPHFEAAHQAFAQEGLTIPLALTEINHANTLYRMGNVPDALQRVAWARARMAEAGRIILVIACDVNAGLMHVAMGEYEAALAMFTRALEACQERGLQVDAARCLVNMALVYEQTGEYAKALDRYQQARNIFYTANLSAYTAMCEQNLGSLYRTIGDLENALAHYGAARQIFADQKMPGFTARCDTQMAAVYIELNRLDEADKMLEQALAVCREQGMAIGANLCEMLIADVARRRGDLPAAIERFTAVRERLRQAQLVVDAAVCSIALGEMALEQGNIAQSQAEFEDALPAVKGGFPDYAWRAAYGLGQAYERQGAARQALALYQEAAEYVRSARSTIWAEENSGQFYNHRRHPFTAGISLALALQDPGAALTLVEKSKGQTFLSLLRAHDATLHANLPAESHVRELLAQEKLLRQQIAQLRGKIALTSHEGLRGAVMPAILPDIEIAAQLSQLEQEHTRTVNTLRAYEVGQTGDPQAVPFDPARFRQIAGERLGRAWACLIYFQEGDALHIFYFDAEALDHWQRTLNRFDALVLTQATDTGENQRSVFYSQPAGRRLSETPTALRHLRELLIPAAVETQLGEGRKVWFVVPHDRLHFLPFHALWGGPGVGYLGQKAALVHAHSLQALQNLLLKERAGMPTTPQRALILGVADFDGRAAPLPHARAEAQAVAAAVPDHTLYLNERATPDALWALQERGELAQYDVIHLATHAIFDPGVPANSRVLLHGGDLSIADIFRLNLDGARIVLSACQTGMSRLHPGDEMVGLLQAFFYAGARSILASLWPVPDASTTELMRRTYEAWGQGQSPAHALQQAQTEMEAGGHSLYQWAGFRWYGLG